MVEALVVYGSEPSTFYGAVQGPERKQWEKAMEEEYESLMKNKTWVVTTLSESRQAIKCKWVFKRKHRADGTVERYKARLVAKGYSQRPGIDYTETFSPVARLESIRLLLAIVAKYNLEKLHFDVKTQFLHGYLSEDIYMVQPEGYHFGSKM